MKNDLNMKNIFFFLIIGVLFWDLSNGLRISGNDFEDKLLESEDPDFDENEIEHDNAKDTAKDKLVENCFVAIFGPSVSCIMKSLNQWSVTPFDLRFALNDRNTCCAIWEMTDCMKNNAQTHCTSEERIQFMVHMNELTERRNTKNCSSFQYQTEKCSSHYLPPNDSPVFTNVLVREREEVEVEPRKRGSGHINSVQRNIQSEDSFSLEQLGLAKRLLDRVQRITINQMVIDLHPVKKNGVHRHEM